MPEELDSSGGGTKVEILCAQIADSIGFSIIEKYRFTKGALHRNKDIIASIGCDLLFQAEEYPHNKLFLFSNNWAGFRKSLPTNISKAIEHRFYVRDISFLHDEHDKINKFIQETIDFKDMFPDAGF